MRNINNINTVIETMSQFSCRNINHRTRRQIHRHVSLEEVDGRQMLRRTKIPRRMISSSRVGAASSNFHTKTSFSSRLRTIQSDLFFNYYYVVVVTSIIIITFLLLFHIHNNIVIVVIVIAHCCCTILLYVLWLLSFFFYVLCVVLHSSVC